MKLVYVSLVVVIIFIVGVFTFSNYLDFNTNTDNDTKSTEIEEETPNVDEVDEDLVLVTNPEPNTVVDNPITITGEARGYWFFEASFPIVVTDWKGLIIGEGYATADSDWMTEDYVPFTATVSYDLPADTPYMRGYLILMKDNPSGLPEHDAAIDIPILFE